MINFRTVFDIPACDFPINYDSKVMLIGSCFSDNIGQKLKKLKFEVLSNPYGVLYNPYSIQEVFNHLLGHRMLDEKDLVQHSGLWHSYLHHGSFSESDKSVLLEKIETVRQESVEFLKKADFLFITFGTAWVYELNTSKRIVSNCHKVPAKEFKRFRLASCDITD
ncbi:MAG: GSCFA domain protein, partial [Salinivirgaceae bacterium]